MKIFNWYNFFLALLPILLTLWQATVFWATDVQKGKHSPFIVDGLTKFVVTYRYWVPLALLLAFLVLYTIKVVKDAVPRVTIRDYLNVLHETHFPHGTKGPSPRHRVTLFVPARWLKWRFIRYPAKSKHLVLYARSGGLHTRSKISWNISKSEEGNYDGIAGYAFATGTFVDVQNLADYNSAGEADKKEYLKRTYITETKVEKLNVKSRSYQALVIQNRDGKKVGLLMMEAEDPHGLRRLTIDKWDEIAKTIQCLFIPLVGRLIGEDLAGGNT